MDLKIKNKVCIITGGAKGIGYGIAKLWASEGGIPVIFSRSMPKEHDKEFVGGKIKCNHRKIK